MLLHSYFGFTCVNTGNSIIGTEVILGNDIVSPLNYGDPINNSAQFNDDYWQYITLKDREIGCLYSNPLSPWDYANLGNWAASIDENKYIGVKFKGKMKIVCIMVGLDVFCQIH